MYEFVTFVLAGGRGNRLRPLTDRRPKPLVPFAGRRLLDFTLLNCLRSGIGEVTLLAQYRAPALHRHLRRAWTGWRGRLRFFSPDDAGRPFRGTADAVRAALPAGPRSRRVLVLAGDHVYRMDYRALLAAPAAAATLSVVEVRRARARGLGVVVLDGAGHVSAFREKSAAPPPAPGAPDRCLASMGIYVFDRTTLAAWLADHPDAVDFGHDVLPGMLRQGHEVGAHRFRGYWRDIADVEAYHEALMDLVCGDFDPGRDWPGFRAPGCACVADNGAVRNSVIGRGVRIGPRARIDECVLLDGVEVGGGARLRRLVVEAGASIPPRARLGGPTAVTVVEAAPRAAVPAPAGDGSPATGGVC